MSSKVAKKVHVALHACRRPTQDKVQRHIRAWQCSRGIHAHL